MTTPERTVLRLRRLLAALIALACAATATACTSGDERPRVVVRPASASKIRLNCSKDSFVS